MAATFSGAMQPSLWPLLQASTAGSKSQPIGSEIILSATPSFASQRFISASMKSLRSASVRNLSVSGFPVASLGAAWLYATGIQRSEEHTSELQSLRHLVCRLLL